MQLNHIRKTFYSYNQLVMNIVVYVSNYLFSNLNSKYMYYQIRKIKQSEFSKEYLSFAKKLNDTYDYNKSIRGLITTKHIRQKDTS